MKAGAKTAERSIVCEGTPRNWIMAVAETHETANAHDRIRDPSRNLVDDEVIDFADMLSPSCPYTLVPFTSSLEIQL